MLSKSDFMTYLEAPMHLWAKMHGKYYPKETSIFEQFLIEQGYQVEKLAEDFIKSKFEEENDSLSVSFQETFSDNKFLARVDAVINDPINNVVDIIEIKSSTSVRNNDKYELAFITLTCETKLPIRNIYLVHLNKKYIKDGSLNVFEFFEVKDVTSDVYGMLDEVKILMEDAWEISIRISSNQIRGCKKPKDCLCLESCHPNLQGYSIYELSRISKKKISQLGSKGIKSITEIPEDFPLTEFQKKQREAVQNECAVFNLSAIADDLSRLKYPLHFLDYESFNPGIPMYRGYGPYQHMVFQFSLHMFLQWEGELNHSEFLSISRNTPEPDLLAHLSNNIERSGSVLVWNKSFESARNKEMAIRYPDYANLLLGLNDRMYDLMEIFRVGNYIHPDFHGSYSIKNVLQILAPNYELQYSDLRVSSGDEAMMTWFEIQSGELTEEEIEQKREELLVYCKLDTLALVEIWRFLTDLVMMNNHEN